MRSIHRRHFALGLSAAAATASFFARAQSSGAPLRLIVPSPPGSIIDALARAMSEPWARIAGRPVVVENVAGAGSLVGTIQLARAPRDGLTLGVINSNHTINPWIFNSVPFDAIADFTPIAMIGNAPMVMVATPAVRARNVEEFVKIARAAGAKPLNEGVVTGSAYQIGSELFKSQARLTTNRIFYKGSAQIVNDLLAGILDVAFVSVQLAAQHIAAGKLVALAVNTTTRTEIAPAIPTFVEAGYPAYSYDVWTGIVGPAGLSPQSVTARLGELQQTMGDAQMKRSLQHQGVVPRTETRAEMLEFMKKDSERNRELIQRIGIKIN